MPIIEIAIGQRFGQLVIAGRAENDPRGNVHWLCRCQCGNVKRILGKSLREGKTKSCGCSRNRSGADHPLWRGGRTISNGYINQRVAKYTMRREHVLIAEKVLGHPLFFRAVVHHVDENRSNNAHANLVICQDNKYHLMLHKRLRALRGCGHADWQRCSPCREWKHPSAFYAPLSGECRECVKERRHQYYARKRREKRVAAG